MSNGYLRFNPIDSMADFLERKLVEKEGQLESAKAGTVIVRNWAITDDLVMVEPGGENYEIGRARYETELKREVAALRKALERERSQSSD